MRVKVKYFLFKGVTGKREEEIVFSGELTVKDLLVILSERYGREFKRRLWDRNGVPKRHIYFLLDGRDIRRLDGLATKLRDGSTLAIIPPLGGG